MATHIDYANLLRGKTVSIVGGHDGVDWDYVDDADYVVRCNGHVARQGRRVDILYDSCACDIDHSFYDNRSIQSQLKFVMLNITHVFFSWTASEYKLVTQKLHDAQIPYDIYVHAPAKLFSTMEQLRKIPPRHQWYLDWIKKWGIYPLTGVLAIHHLLRQPIKSLYIDGMDLGLSQISEDLSKRSWLGLHYLPPQRNYLKEVVLKDRRVHASSNFWRAVYYEGK